MWLRLEGKCGNGVQSIGDAGLKTNWVLVAETDMILSQLETDLFAQKLVHIYAWEIEMYNEIELMRLYTQE